MAGEVQSNDVVDMHISSRSILLITLHLALATSRHSTATSIYKNRSTPTSIQRQSTRSATVSRCPALTQHTLFPSLAGDVSGPASSISGPTRPASPRTSGRRDLWRCCRLPRCGLGSAGRRNLRARWHHARVRLTHGLAHARARAACRCSRPPHARRSHHAWRRP